MGLLDWIGWIRRMEVRVTAEHADQMQSIGCMGIEPSDLARHLSIITHHRSNGGAPVPVAPAQQKLDVAVSPLPPQRTDC